MPDGTVGELACRGPYTITGYYRADGHNATAFTSDGFYRTGDLVTRHVLDGRAYYAIDGRIKDVINRGAEKIHAEEIEELLVRHPGVHAAAVVAMPDPGARGTDLRVRGDGRARRAPRPSRRSRTSCSARAWRSSSCPSGWRPSRGSRSQTSARCRKRTCAPTSRKQDPEGERAFMRLDSVAVLGGGPGGLYAARLLKLAHPGATVRVYEQSVPEHTFGFGVAVAGRTQRNLEQADPATQADVIAAGRPHDVRMIVGGDAARVHNGPLIGIARTELLAVLDRHAEAAGVELHHGGRRRAEEFADADLVIVADGVNSRTRTEHAAGFGAHVDVADGLYLWAGADFALETAIFTPVTTAHGTFVTHAYPYVPRPQHVPHRNRRGRLAGRRIRRHDRGDRARCVRHHRAGLPPGRVRRGPGRPPPDRQPNPLDALPHRALRAVVAGQHGAARRRRAHRALLRRIRDQARDGGRDRAARRDHRRARPAVRPCRLRA